MIAGKLHLHLLRGNCFRTQEQTVVMILQAKLALQCYSVSAQCLQKLDIIMAISLQQNSYEGNTRHLSIYYIIKTTNNQRLGFNTQFYNISMIKINQCVGISCSKS
jgi:hypothetical protein